MQHFDFHEIFKAEHPAFTANARLLIAAKRASGAREGTIDANHASPQFARNPVGLGSVGGLDIGRQTIGRIIGDLDGVFFAVKRDHDNDGAKDFFARDAHIIVHIGKDGWFGEVSFVNAIRFAHTPDQKFRPFVNACLNKGLNPVILDVADQWADMIAFGRCLLYTSDAADE